MELTRPCPGAFEFKAGPLTIVRVGRLAIICLRWLHVLKVGRRLVVCRGRHHA